MVSSSYLGKRTASQINDLNKVFCSTCNADCTAARYHAGKKQPTIDICTPCYTDGRFPSTNYSSDFVLLKQDSTPQEAWSDAETLLLLEGLELYSEDWSKISLHVKTRNRQECIIKFLQLPIQSSVSPSHIPITSASDNPIVSLAAFIASGVNPKVALASAKAAISQLETDQEYLFPADSTLEKAAATALGSAAAKSKTLEKFAEKECARLTNQLIQTQMAHIEMKMAHFDQMVEMLEHEKKEIQLERARLYCERLNFKKVRENSSFTSVGDGVKVSDGYPENNVAVYTEGKNILQIGKQENGY